MNQMGKGPGDDVFCASCALCVVSTLALCLFVAFSRLWGSGVRWVIVGGMCWLHSTFPLGF